MTEDCDVFIRANTILSPAYPGSPIKLHLAVEGTDFWREIETEMETGLGPPPFWAFAWAGGQALARYIGENPALVAGKRVLDFGAGCGLAGIAASLAGASHVEASDLDPFAKAAITLNAVENAVTITTTLTDLVGSNEPWDVILAGDVAYQGKMAPRILDWLKTRAQQGALVLIGDPGRAHLSREHLYQRATYEIAVPLMLEGAVTKLTHVWSFV